MEGPSRRRVAAWLGLITAAWWTVGVVQAIPAGPAAEEIESLIEHVSRLSGAEEFIRWCATRLEETGRTYEVLLPGGVALPASETLREVLRQLRTKRP